MDMNINPEMLKNLQPLVIDYGSKIIAAFLIFLVGKWIARKITNVMVKVLDNRNIDVTLTRFLEAIVYYALFITVIIAAAGSAGY